MAKPAARKGDDVAHKKGAGAILDGSANVLINSRPASRQGDPVQHNQGVEPITQGSSTVSFNSKAASRTTDKVGCGGKIAVGSANVLIGDGGVVACSTCPGGVAVGSPVNPLLGAKVLAGADELDFALPGAMSLVWQRHYSSYVGPAGAQAGLLGLGWRLPFEMHLQLCSDKTELFDTKNRVITFEALLPGAQAHSVAEGFWLLRGGRTDSVSPPPALPEGLTLDDLHPATRSHYQPQPWQDEPRWAHIPSAWREDQHYCLAATAERNVWVFACLEPANAASPWLLVALIDVFGRSQRFERAVTPESRNLRQGLFGSSASQGDPELPLGQLCAIQDGLGRRFELAYTQIRLGRSDAVPGDKGLRLAGVSVQDLQRAELQRALGGKPLVRYHYSPAGDLIKVEDRHGRLLREFSYSHHRISSHRVLGGPLASYTYQSERLGAKVVWQRNEGGLDYHFDYQAGQTVVTDSLKRTTVYAFKGEGGKQRLSQLTDALGNVTTYEHNLYGQLVQEIDPLGRLTQYQRDQQGRITAVVLPDGSSTRSSWDSEANTLTRITGPDGAGSNFRYDAWGRLLRIEAPDGSCTEHRYSDPTISTDRQSLLTAEQPRQIIDAKGGIKTLHWSETGQLLRYTDCSGHSTEYQYDLWGELSRISNALGQATHYQRNALGQISSVTHADQTQTHYHYDAVGQLTQIVDAAGGSTRFERDRLGRVVASISSATSGDAEQVLRYHYDQASRLSQLTNENGAVTRFGYDALDRLIEEVGFDGRTQRYQYDAASQLGARADHGGLGNGQLSVPLLTRYHYDLAGRLVRREVPTTAQPENDGPLAALLSASTQHFSYDKAGRLVQAHCEHGSAKTTVQFGRDAMGRLSEESLHCQDSRSYPGAALTVGTSNSAANLSTRFSHTLRHRYDELGVRSSSVLPHVGTIDYLHYGSGHLHQVAHNQSALVDFERDALHREVQRSLSGVSAQSGVSGVSGGAGGLSFARELDPMGRLAGLRAYPLNTALSRRYAYDPIGQLIAIGQDRMAGAARFSAQSALTRFRYDAAHRLVGAHYPDGASQAWRFDPAGNRLPEPVQGELPTQHITPGQGSAHDWTRRAAPRTSPAAQCYPDNRVQQASTQDGTQLIEYDAWGNVRRILTTSGAQQGRSLDLLYDALHQLRASRLFEPGAPPQGSGQFTTTYYDYDALGRRISKTSFTQVSVQAAATAKRSWFGWDGDRLVSTETDTAEGRERVCTVYEPQSFVPLLRFAWAHQEEGKANSEAPPDPQLLYYHCNHLGTPEALIDRQGQLVWQAEFDPWGNLRSEFNPQQLDQLIRMQGQQLDVETGLFYNRYRYYAPAMGRYVTQDPIGLAGGIDTYAYANGSPTTRTDPLGLMTFMCTKPLHGLGDTWGPRMYPESQWNPSPAYHQFLCVKDASGKATCGGQDRTGGAFVPGSPGKPSDDSWPSPGHGSCKEQDNRDCVDQCVIKAVSNPSRPWYAIGPLGTDCQEWADEALKKCQKQCNAKK